MLVSMAMLLAIYIVGCEVYSQVNDYISHHQGSHIIAPPTDVLDMT